MDMALVFPYVALLLAGCRRREGQTRGQQLRGLALLAACSLGSYYALSHLFQDLFAMLAVAVGVVGTILVIVEELQEKQKKDLVDKIMGPVGVFVVCSGFMMFLSLGYDICFKGLDTLTGLL